MTRLSATIAVISMVTARPALSATPVLRAADARITIASRTSCDVRLSVTIDGATEVEHRLARADGDGRQLVTVEGAGLVEPIRDVGATVSLRLRPTGTSYSLSYSVQHREPIRIRFLDPVRDRCPIWLPTIPTDGRSRAVRMTIELPPGSTAGATMPALAWNGSVGTATLGHLPSIVRVPYAANGEAMPWSLPGAIDTLAISTVAAATAAWIWRVRR
ncbi:MAG TPA: hypothetical protein VKE96_11655 [Vicinamibacterales bacterium]|nr:hypothetical protein [Vicinamibacterales bacterium]